jgi:hypothetical protein
MHNFRFSYTEEVYPMSLGLLNTRWVQNDAKPRIHDIFLKSPGIVLYSPSLFSKSFLATTAPEDLPIRSGDIPLASRPRRALQTLPSTEGRYPAATCSRHAPVV